ncbi:MAG: sigma-70 family RNA polymerase sigma factor [Balneolaceae bacterium]|nr:sigma-70 family RNA polymerase sigma factor [Balneolaceae bacterium]
MYKGLLFGMILSVVGDREEAEDLLQEVFLRIWEKASSFDESRGNVYSWVVTLARNRAIDRIRSKGYKTREKQSQVLNDEERGPTLEGQARDPLTSTIYADRAEAVTKALREIPDEQRKVIEIAY